MKIGIITFHAAYNYGAFLQTYALQNVLLNKGHNTEIINYLPKYLLTPYYASISLPKYNKNSSIIKNILNIPLTIAINTINYPQAKRRIRYFKDTIAQNLRVSPDSFSTYDELAEGKETYDRYILGSDQIWNPSITGNKLDPAFFLYYLTSGAMISTYAASMGNSNLSTEHIEDFKRYSQNLKTISIRECSAIPFVQEHTGKEVQCVLDPTLLLTVEEWEKYAVEPKKHPQKFLLSYSFGTDPEYFRAVKNIAKKSGLEVVWLHNKGAFCKYFMMHNYVRPEEFVWYFANASAVITASFHGTVFSLINKKPFYSVAPRPKSVRIEDHLRRLGLLDRLYDSADKLPDTVTEIDYTKPCEKLEEWRQKSFAYLDMITKPDDEQ